MHEYADELYHWKYLKKVKKNGEWVYYYTKEQLRDALGYDERDEYHQAFLNQIEAHSNVIKKQQEQMKAMTNGMTNVSEKKQQVDMAKASLESAKKETDRALAKYGNTPLGKYDNLVRGIRSTIDDVIKYTKIDDKPKRPKGREKNVTGQAKPFKRRGYGINNR